MPDFASWQGGKTVRLGPMSYDKIDAVIAWLHDQHGGHNRWSGMHSAGFTGYQGGVFKVKPLGVEHAQVVLDVLLPDDAAAMMCWLNWA